MAPAISHQMLQTASKWPAILIIEVSLNHVCRTAFVFSVNGIAVLIIAISLNNIGRNKKEVHFICL